MQKSTKLSLKKQLELQEILSDVNSNFVAFDEKNAKVNIETALARLGNSYMRIGCMFLTMISKLMFVTILMNGVKQALNR
jgi:hypothetical protein